MPMKPRKDESQSEFMARCVPDMIGTGKDKRPQEQAVAACLDIWRREKPGSKKVAEAEVQRIIALWCKLLEAKASVPEPDVGESHGEFIDRCTEELVSDGIDEADAEDSCEMAWEESRTADALEYRTHAERATKAGNGWNFVMSDSSIDRMGETINVDGWNIDNFKSNPIALFSHDARFIVGQWHDIHVKGGQLRGRLELAPEGTSARIDEIRRLVEADILRAVSVGFKSLKKEPLDERSDPFFGPFRYLQQELVECSLVAVPANAGALAIAKNLGISADTLDLVFAGQGKGNGIVRRAGVTGGQARTYANRRGSKIMSTLSERIAAMQTDIVAKRDALEAIYGKMDNDNVPDADLETVNTLNADILRMEKTLETWVASEKILAKSTAGNGNGSSRALTVLHDQRQQNGGGQPSVAGPVVIAKQKKELEPLEYMVRAGTVMIRSKEWRKPFEQTRQQIYGDDDVTKAVFELVARAASAPAMTTVTGWAAELAQTTYTALMDLLMPKGVYARLAPRGLALSFGRAGRIVVPTRSRTPTLAGSFVGEGLAIPVRQGAFTSTTLTPKKVAVITVWTKEMDEHSTPAIEGILRDAIQTDTTVAIDSVLLDTNAATVIRPAGLLNGVTTTGATAGGGVAAIVGDLKNLIGQLVTGTYGNLRNLVWLMNPAEMLSASLANTNGLFPWKDEIGRGTLNNIPIIDSSTVPVKTVILMDAADFVSVGGEGPRFELSDQATLHMEDTSPLELVGTGSPGTVASPQRSLFQTDSIALRMVMPLNWTQRRPGTIAALANVTW